MNAILTNKMPPSSPLTITADHVTYTINMLPTETDIARLWIIEKQQPRTQADFFNSVILSYHWYYHHIYGCEYNASIQRKIEALD
jgi:hypothetical protein